jgi:phosphoribosyl 1,2-cyclic phosphodiesterase
MGLFFQVLASGSKGNSVLVCSEKTRVLFDAGLSAKEILRRLERTGVNANQLSGLVLSHEHQDHVRGAGTLSRRFDLPAYLSQGTLENLPSQVGHLPGRQLFQTGSTFAVGDLLVEPFSISHDAAEPAGFIITHNGCRLGICTDCGTATQLVRARLRDCDAMVIEANHDTQMLLTGPYPPELKQRIRSRHGHLSNDDTFQLLEELLHERLRAVVFAHLSETNNHPDLVLESCRRLRKSEKWQCVRFELAKQNEPTPPLELNANVHEQ